MGHVNNASYLKWVQAAVLSHWRRIAPPDAVAAHLWVALKHEITYRKPAFLEDQIVATVMLEKVQRESAFYETVIKRGEEVLAEVKRSEEHTSELQSIMRISYAVFCLKKKTTPNNSYNANYSILINNKLCDVVSSTTHQHA